MISQEENDLLTRVGPGTPMGNVFRSFWLPALPSPQVAAPNGAPIRLRLLGEDLLAFRDSNGEVGIVEPHCAHRRAPLFFGRNEECGLRCIYHGWKFDIHGRCVDIPNLAQGNASLKDRVSIKAYPTREAGGVVWIYMGAAEHMGELPQFEWMRVPATHRSVASWLQETNWLQGVEGEIDSAHVSFLHSWISRPTTSARIHRPLTALDKVPKLIVKETDYGLISAARRKAGERDFYWRLTQWLLPMYSMIPSADWALGGRAWVPIDDHHTYTWDFSYTPDHPLSEEFYEAVRSGRSFPPEMEPHIYTLSDGHRIDTWRPKRNRDNDYLLDRRRQHTENFSGIHGSNDQDRALQENMGAICDRTREQLVATDVAIVAARRRLRQLALDLENGQKPVAAAAHGDWYDIRALDTISPEADLAKLVEIHRSDMLGRAPTVANPQREVAE
jgi:phthalate 4,5-dioxygenase